MSRGIYATKDRTDPWGAWMEAAQDGDGVAYRTLLLAITPYLRAIAARLLTDPSQVEDAVQDILIAVHEARRSYDPARPFRPWLAGIARHRIIDRMRAIRRRAVREIPLSPEHEWLDPAHRPAISDGNSLAWAMNQLPATQKLAIQRLKLGEQSLRAVSAETGLTQGALKAATHRALARPRRLLVDGQPA